MSSTSYWLELEKETYPKLQGSLKADVVVVGGGISGLTTAYYLARAGVDTIVLEALSIGSGTTGHTTAHITSQHDMTYARYISRFGIEKSRLAATANEEAIEEICRIAVEENIDCDLQRLSHYLFTNKQNTLKQLEEEYKASEKLGIKASLSLSQTFLFPYRLAMEFQDQAQFHPLKYMQGLAKAFLKYKGRIFEESRVLHIEEGLVKTKEGEVSAKNIVVATHNPVINFPGAYFARMYQHRSYCMMFDNAPSFEGMWNCADQNGHSYRMYDGRLIISGESHKCGTQKQTNHYALLKDFGLKVSKNMQRLFQWSAQDGITLDNLSYIGKYGRHSRGLFTMTGFGKWGMTQSNFAGRIVRDLILEKPNPYTEVFSPQRKLVPVAYWNAFYINSSTLFHFVTGVFRFKPPLCAHMKCRLKWNPDEKTWDCPCHGSRFRQNGSVIDTPAIHDLKRK